MLALQPNAVTPPVQHMVASVSRAVGGVCLYTSSILRFRSLWSVFETLGNLYPNLPPGDVPSYQDILFLVNIPQLATTTTTRAPPATQLPSQQLSAEWKRPDRDTDSSQLISELFSPSAHSGRDIAQLSFPGETASPRPNPEQHGNKRQQESPTGDRGEAVGLPANRGFLPSSTEPIDDDKLRAIQTSQPSRQEQQRQRGRPLSGSDNRSNVSRGSGLLPGSPADEVDPRLSANTSEERWASRTGRIPQRRLVGSPSLGFGSAFKDSPQLRRFQTVVSEDGTVRRFYAHPEMASTEGAEQIVLGLSHGNEGHARPGTPAKRRLATEMRPEGTELLANTREQDTRRRLAGTPISEAPSSSVWPTVSVFPASERNSSAAALADPSSASAASSAVIPGVLRSVEMLVAETCGALCQGITGEPLYSFSGDHQEEGNGQGDSREASVLTDLPEVVSIPVRVSPSQRGSQGGAVLRNPFKIVRLQQNS